MPKPPPTSGVTTRSVSGAILSTALARMSRTRCEPWLPSVSVYRPDGASYSATTARVSRKLVTRRWLTMLSETVLAAAANAAAVARASPSVISKAALPARSGHTCGAPGLRASSAPTTWGSGCQSIVIASAASFACSMVSATMKATASPT